MEQLLDLVIALAPVLVWFALPLLASTLSALVAAFTLRRLQKDVVHEEPAGVWLAAVVAGRLPATSVGTAPVIAGSANGYWPDQDYIGLAPATWADQSPAGRAVAAHEFGHAATCTHDPSMANRFARCRRLVDWSGRVALVLLLPAALFQDATLLALGLLAIVVSALASAGVLADEGLASLNGARLLDEQHLRSRGTDLAMGAAFAVYATPLLCWAALVPFAPTLFDAALAPRPERLVNSPALLWSVLLGSPVLILRLMQVLSEYRDAPVPRTAFQLNFSMLEEHRWAFHSGILVSAWLALGYDQPIMEGLAWGFVVALIPAVDSIRGLGRLLVFMPVLTVMTLLGIRTTVLDATAPAGPDPLPFVRQDRSWLARIAGLTRIAWLPLALVLFVRALSGW